MKRLLILSLLLVTACSPGAKTPAVSSEEALTEIRLQKHMAVRERMEQIERLYRVGLPILAANAPLCGKKVWPHHGMMLESLVSVPEPYKDAMKIYYGLQNQLSVAYVLEGLARTRKARARRCYCKSQRSCHPLRRKGSS